MSGTPIIVGVGLVDEVRIAGTSGLSRTFAELGVAAPGDGRTMRVVFEKKDPTYRRLDRVSRCLVLAAEAAGVGRLLSPEQCQEAALLAESSVGCVEIDRRYTSSLAGEMVEAAIFPYTLPSTSLGEVALRHGLRGPTISLSVEPTMLGQSLREGQRMMAAGEVRHVVVGSVDVLDEGAPGIPAAMRTIVAVLAAADSGLEPVAEWPGDCADPFAVIGSALSQSE